MGLRGPKPRFDRYIVEDKGHDTPCWIWTGTQVRGGYGQVTHRTAHRVLYEIHVGPVPDGLQLDHLCFQTACVNPEHLEPVTAAENMRRAAARFFDPDRFMGCGHPRGENQYVNPYTAKKHCRTCGRDAATRYRQKRRTQAT